MTNQNEALSALVDDALGADEAQQLLARLHAAPDTAQRDAAQRLERFALLGEMMRADTVSPWMMRSVQRDVVAEVMQQIRVDALQPNAAMPEKVAPVSIWLGDWMSGWRAPAFSMALAASVAGVMLLVVQPESPVEPGQNVLTAQVKQQAEERVKVAASAGFVSRSTPVLAETPTAPESLAALESAAESDVMPDMMPDTYLLQHLTHAEGGPMRNLSSNVRLASYERP